MSTRVTYHYALGLIINGCEHLSPSQIKRLPVMADHLQQLLMLPAPDGFESEVILLWKQASYPSNALDCRDRSTRLALRLRKLEGRL